MPLRAQQRPGEVERPGSGGQLFVTELPTAGWKLERLHGISQIDTSSFAITGATATVQYEAADRVV